jgi:hypothetical protein
MLKATVNGLQRLRTPEDVALARGLTVAQVLPVSKARREAAAAAAKPEVVDVPEVADVTAEPESA